MKTFIRHLYIIIIIFTSCACSPINDEMAQNGVREFHDMYQQKNYAEIYSKTSSSFKSATTESEFINLLTTANNKNLGKLKSSHIKVKKKIHHIIGNNEVVLVYLSEFSNRIVYETFLFEDVKGTMELKGYNYESLN
ncbi:MAG: type IV secretion protein Rhs [Hafnia sp.]|uniref:type IV secretion protein Rhs n=1 Tax=Hafnia sp. TaxID=1873498 RepID=UPI0026EBF4BB|nr:type IV secretion protein Rhs [Hafnia alvei]